MRSYGTLKLTTADASTMAMRESARTDVGIGAMNPSLQVAVCQATRADATIRSTIGRRIGMLHHQVHEWASEARYGESPVSLLATITRATVGGPLLRRDS
jgi:hypothetical protein